ncbi:MAG: formate dehydrogenase subunit alpha [Actinobacteria bacterium]|nr:formate dehydrogenase subunit alpha [Actinomycetota bacterium]
MHATGVALTIDGRPVVTTRGATLYAAATAAGIDIPTICYHPNLKASANCRLCVVEAVRPPAPGEMADPALSLGERAWVSGNAPTPGPPPGALERGESKLLPACKALAEPGLVIFTRSANVRASRRGTLRLLLGGVDLSEAPDLAALLAEYGVDIATGVKRDPFDVYVDNPYYIRDYNKCVMCWRCVDTCGTDVQHTFAIEPGERGFHVRVSTHEDRGIMDTTCVYCGNCVQVCPSGALKGRALWEAERQGLRHDEAVVHTTCSFCGVGCGLDVRVRGGKITHVLSPPNHPVNQGWLCVKGRFGWDYVQSPDRLTHPLIRVGARGAGQWRQATWDEALELVARRLAAIRDAHGPDALAVYGSSKCTNEDNYLLQKLTRVVLGTNNIDNCTRLCHASSVAALGMSLGTGAFTNSLDEIAENDVIYVTGSNTTETHPITALKMKAAIRNGATLIVADPRAIELCQWAAVHLQFRTGTDVPMYNALLHVLVRDDLIRKDFIAKRVRNFEAAAEAVAHWTPARAGQLTGIPPATLERAAHIIGKADKTAFYWGLGISEHTHGTEACLTLINLALATGNVGRRGTGLNPLRGQNNVQGTSDVGAIPMYFPDYRSVENAEFRSFFEAAWGAQLPAKQGLTTIEIGDAAGRGEVRGMYIMGENPLMSDPDLHAARAHFQNLDFLAVQDIFMTETAAIADVVLPASSWAEKDGTYTNTDRRVQRVRPVLPLPGNARADWAIIADLARRMGRDLGLSSPSEIFAEIARVTPSHRGLSHARLDREGGIRWPCRDEHDPGAQWLFGDRFPTADGKAIMHVVDWRESVEIPDATYPFIFNTGRVLYHWHTGALTRRSKLDAAYPEPLVEVSPEDAERLGIPKSGKVRLSSRRGSLECRAWITRRVAPGTVYMSWHFAEAAANLLTINALDPVSRIPEYKICACQLEPLESTASAVSPSLRSARA